MIMLDTNAASARVRNLPEIKALVDDGSGQRIVVSAATAGELLFGIERKPVNAQVVVRVRSLLETIETCPRTLDAARTYGHVRADCTRRGRALGSLDLLIASHAISVAARLAARDRSFAKPELADLKIVTF